MTWAGVYPVLAQLLGMGGGTAAAADSTWPVYAAGANSAALTAAGADSSAVTAAGADSTAFTYTGSGAGEEP